MSDGSADPGDSSAPPDQQPFVNLGDERTDPARQAGNSRGAAREWEMTAALANDEARAHVATVLIVEDHALLADGLVAALRRNGVRAEVAAHLTTEEVLASAHSVQPDVVLLDLMLGGEIGLSIPLIGQLSEVGRQVLILTGITDAALLGSCIEAGAAGVLSKRAPFDEVLETLIRVAQREPTLDLAERDRMLHSMRERRAEERNRLAPFERLTARERMVLHALMDGQSAEHIAESSFVSMATVRSQIHAILEKLGVHSQLAAVALAHRAHWEP
jgi:DNA-binding NarL/FixJ family response regulator